MSDSKKPVMFLVDGSSMLTTAYYGTLPMSVKQAKTEEEKQKYYKDIMMYKGKYINAIYTMTKNILKIIKNCKPDYFAVAFDEKRDATFRKKLYPEYKGTRKTSPEPLIQQRDAMPMILANIGLYTASSLEYEADDIVATLVSQYKEDYHIIVLTKDHDYLQLISKDVEVWMMQTESSFDAIVSSHGEITAGYVFDRSYPFTEKDVLLEMGVRPHQIPDLKALVGDTSDNIPGIKGIAEKSAIPLLQEYGTVEGIYQAIKTYGLNVCEEWININVKSRKTIYGKFVADGAEEICMLSKRLATMEIIKGYNTSIDDMKTKLDREKFMQTLNEYGMGSIVKHI